MTFESPSVSIQEVPQEAYGGQGQAAPMTPGKPNHEEMSVSQQERPSSLLVSVDWSLRDDLTASNVRHVGKKKTEKVPHKTEHQLNWD